ncbi:MAG: D-alanyl-lipoteichoic acid biosynthesis protein DltB, partial [Chthoniobacteraceae bacterium]
GALAQALVRRKSRSFFRVVLVLSLLPLATAKFVPLLSPGSLFGFLGISYVSFRALDVLFSIHDGVIEALEPGTYFAFLFFWPTVSAGPIDRYRRFSQDLARHRTRAEFLDDLNTTVEHVFRGFLYKFLIAALIRTFWMDRIPASPDPSEMIAYMYAYSLYLFFDFAGYSAFAVGVSHLFGIRTPENFHIPFLARNIREFWNRWHISLSFWFRDHVYMRFLLAAAKGKWFTSRHTAAYLGLWLTFGLMGIWHGLEPHYLLYGAYHATLLCGYDTFARWNKKAKRWPDTPAWRAANIILTFHIVCFGLLIFSGKLTQSGGHPSNVSPQVSSPR